MESVLAKRLRGLLVLDEISGVCPNIIAKTFHRFQNGHLQLDYRIKLPAAKWFPSLDKTLHFQIVLSAYCTSAPYTLDPRPSRFLGAMVSTCPE